MKVIQLPDVLHEYLVRVVQDHAAGGIHPEEGIAIAKLWEAVTKTVTHVPDQEIARMAAAGAPSGQSVPEAVATNNELESRIEGAKLQYSPEERKKIYGDNAPEQER
jgi:hypothetical protein